MQPSAHAESRTEPLLEEGQQQRSGRRYVALMVSLFIGKFVIALGQQSVRIFAPFLAKEAGDLTLAQYRLGFIAMDVVRIFPAFLPLQDVSPRRLACGSLLTTGLSVLLPHTLLDGRGMPLALAACRAFQSLAQTVFTITVNATLGNLPDHERTKLLAWLEVSWFLASFAIPVYGELLERGSGLLTVLVLLVVPSAVTALACAFLLPSQSESSAGDESSSGEDSPKLQRIATVWRRAGGILTWRFFMGAANTSFLCTYGTWLHEAFGLSAAGVGFISNAIGAGNLAGNVLTQFAASVRWPAGVMVAVVTVFLCIISLFFCVAQAHITVWALAALMLCYFTCVETGFLSGVSYTSQLAGTENITGQSLWQAVFAVGALFGDWVAPYFSMQEVFASGSFLWFCGLVALLPSLRASKGEPTAVVPPSPHP